MNDALGLNKLFRVSVKEASMSQTQQEIRALLASLRANGMYLVADRLQDLVRDLDCATASADGAPAGAAPDQRIVS